MKKILSLTLTLVMILALGSQVFAGSDSALVYVTICDQNGSNVIVREAITVTDTDSDGKLTVNDALYCAHEAKYTGGAAAGYATELTAYGISMTKLWGHANGGAYGYFINNNSAMSLSDTVKDGDLVNAYVYRDLVTWSDTFCYFDKSCADVKTDEKLTLKLFASGFDANFMPVTTPVSGAAILINGKDSGLVTDINGCVTLELASEGDYLIEASSTAMTMVTPACVVSVSNASANTGDTAALALISSVCALFALAIVVNCRKKHEI